MNVRMQQGSSIFSSIFALNPEKEKKYLPAKRRVLEEIIVYSVTAYFQPESR